MDFLESLRRFLSTDNAVRRQAEDYLFSLMVHRNELPLELLKILRTTPELRFRSLSAVLLRRVLEKEVAPDVSLWFEMSPDAQNTVKEQLLLAIEDETDKSLRKKLCDTTATVASALFDEGNANESWPEIWAAMYKWVTAGNTSQQIGSLILFEMLSDFISVQMSESFAVFAEIFRSKLMDDSAEFAVRVAAARAAVGVIVSIAPKSSDMEHFKPLLPYVVKAFSESVERKDGDSAEVLISILIDVVDRHATAFKPFLHDIVSLMCGIAGNTEVYGELRRLTLEFLTSMAEKAPGLCRKLDPPKYFLNSVFPIIMHMLMEYGLEEPTDAEWNADNGQDLWEDGEDCNIPVAEEAFSRISEALGDKHTVPTVLPIIWDVLSPSYTGTPEWKWKVAGVVALTNCCRLLGDNSEEQMPIAQKIVELFAHESPRVRHAALGAVGNFCEYKGPLFQLNTGAIILPMVAAALKDPWTRVQVNAAHCVTAFTSNLEPEVETETLAEHTQALFHSLFDLIGSGSTAGKEAAMTAVSGLIDVSGSTVAEYYDLIVPAMENILAMEDVSVPSVSEETYHARRQELREVVAHARHVRLMKGLALEVLTIMGKVAGIEKFRPDAHVAMEGIIAILRQLQIEKAAGASKSDDPIYRFLWEAVGRIGKVLQEEFEPYISVVLPPLLEEVATRVEFSEIKPKGDDEDEAASDDDDEEGEEDYLRLQDGRKEFRVRTAALEDKESAVRAVVQIFAHCNKVHLAPYVTSCKAALLPILQIAGAPFADVRVNAVSAIADVIGVATKCVTLDEAAAAHAALLSIDPSEDDFTSIAEDFSHPSASAAATGLINMTCEILSALLSASLEEEEHDMIEAFVGSVHDIIQTVCTRQKYADGPTEPVLNNADKYMPFFHQKFMEKIALGVVQLRQSALQRRAVRIGEQKLHADDYDAEALEDMQALEDLDARLVSICFDIVTILFTAHRTHFLPVYTKHLAEIATTFAHPECIAADRASAIYLMVDVLEFCGEEGFDTRSGNLYIHEYMPVIIHSITADHEAVRQACLYGIGVFAENCPVSCMHYMKQMLEGLEWAMDHPVGGRRSTVEDNAVTALGKIILNIFTGHEIDPSLGLPSRDDLVTRFLLRLPLKHDRDEAKVAVHMLCTMLDNRDPDVVGSDGADHARIGHVLHVFATGMRDPLVRNDFLAERVAKCLLSLRTSLPEGDLGHIWGSLSAEDRDTLVSLSS